MRRGLRRIAFVVTMLFIAVAASGCFFLDKDRRENFKGPSWDLPVKIELTNQDFTMADVLALDLDDDGYVEDVDGFEFKIPSGWDGNKRELDTNDLRQSIDPIDLSDLWAEMPENETDVKLLPTAFLDLRLDSDVALEMTLGLKISGWSNGKELESKEKQVVLRGGEYEEVELSSVLAKQPDTLKVELTKTTIESKSDDPPNVPQVKSEAKLRVPFFPLTVRFDASELSLADPDPVHIDSDIKKTLGDIPLSDVQFVVDARDKSNSQSALPFDFLILEFLDGDDDLEPAKLMVSLSGKAQSDDETDAWRKALDKLQSDDPHVAVKLQVHDDNKEFTFDKDTAYEIEAYMVLEIAVNKK